MQIIYSVWFANVQVYVAVRILAATAVLRERNRCRTMRFRGDQHAAYGCTPQYVLKQRMTRKRWPPQSCAAVRRVQILAARHALHD